LVPVSAFLIWPASPQAMSTKAKGFGIAFSAPWRIPPTSFWASASGIHQFLIGRPLLLELLECGLVGHRALGVEVMDVDVHFTVASRPPD
jgi:hypothetical protein